MKFSYRLSDAIHILAYIAICSDEDLSSRAIAMSIGSNASVVRNTMRDLKSAGLIKTKVGSAQPLLERHPSEINLFEIYQAINKSQPLLHVDPKTNPNCKVGGNIQETLTEVYTDIEQAVLVKMKSYSLEDIIEEINLRNLKK